MNGGVYTFKKLNIALWSKHHNLWSDEIIRIQLYQPYNYVTILIKLLQLDRVQC